MKKRKNPLDPVPEHALVKLAPSRNAELFIHYPFLDPSKRDKPIVCVVSRHKNPVAAERSKRGIQRGDQRIIVRIGAIKFDSRTFSEPVAAEFVRVLIAAFEPETITIDHSNGELHTLEKLLNTHGARSKTTPE